jgi:hypothetical protein
MVLSSMRRWVVAVLAPMLPVEQLPGGYSPVRHELRYCTVR